MASLLIVGILPYDSGKTTLALSLIREALEHGIDVGVAKPVSGFNGWYQYEYLLKSVEFGFLIGEDSYKLHMMAKSSDPIYLESPVTALLLPPDPERVGWKSSSYTAISYHTNVVLLRILEDHFHVPDNIKKLTRPMQEVIAPLIEATKPLEIKAEDVQYLIMEGREEADRTLEIIRDHHELTIIESYNNLAAPCASALNSDLVIAVAPGKAVILDGERYKKAIHAISNLREPWRVVTEDVVPLLKPLKKFEFKPGEVSGLLNSVLEILEAKTF
ncbi:ATPase [Pyrococcus kukulkanii]|uniref:ATPase n=1 Tax=Pyrococcus kukulkanii TaxID=1609559 RepID=A0A127BC68_9EURY|nr:ATPase [Pyrococcus kukulkanii]AMM54912.1 ATPase [Pyrococcus kukulkanii]